MLHCKRLLPLIAILLVPALSCLSCVTTQQTAPAGGPATAGPAPAVIVYKSVAVWDPDNLTPQSSLGQADLGEVLSARIIQAAEKKGGWTTVERQRLLTLLEELNLGSTEIVDESTRLRLGKLSGARVMVFGGYQTIAGKTRLDLRLVDVETGRVLKTSERIIQGQEPAKLLDAADAASGEIFD